MHGAQFVLDRQPVTPMPLPPSTDGAITIKAPIAIRLVGRPIEQCDALLGEWTIQFVIFDQKHSP